MSLRPILIVMAIAAILAIITGFFLSDEIINTNGLQVFSGYIAEIFPCVSVVANHSINPARAALIWSVQWLFFPIYLFVWLIALKPWSAVMKIAVVKQVATLSRGHCLMVIPGIMILSAFILSDFGLINFLSFFRGDIFETSRQTINKLPTVLSLPYISNIGMVFYAWLIPLCNAIIYWLFLFFFVNFKFYIRTRNSD